MAIEIERKFLVCADSWRTTVVSRQRYVQGYLSKTPRVSVRIRRAGALATLTLKGPRHGIAREEFEYPIPADQAEAMLRRFCAGLTIDKIRHWAPYDGIPWQVDEYFGSALGLVVAEIELAHPQQVFSLPPWVGAEITHDPRYRNSAIARPSWRNPQLGEPPVTGAQVSERHPGPLTPHP
ncbi:MAG: CYTH domain-containing protein [Phenylobacterium sp.]